MDPEYFKSHDMWWGTMGTVRPFSNFHPDRDATELQEALDKKDTVSLVRILTNRSNAQRQLIASTFEELTQKDLASSLKKSLSGELETLLLELLMPPVQHQAQRLQGAMQGLGTDEETLLEILCTQSGGQLQEISAAYKQLFKKDLDKELKGETSGDFAKLVLALLNKANVAGGVLRDMESLAASLSGKKADADPWINILTSRDPQHLSKVLLALELHSGQSLDELLDKRFSGDIQLGLRVLVQCIQSPDLYLARRLSNMKASVVQGIMVSHSEDDLLSIRVAFLKLTGSSLYTTLQKHFKGEHLQALLAVCRSED